MIKYLTALILSGTVLIDGGRSATEQDLLRGFVFSVCLAEAYKGTPFERDANRTAEFYREVGHTNQQVTYTRLGEFARLGTPGTIAPVDGRNLGIMRCLELYESKSLRALVRKPR